MNRIIDTENINIIGAQIKTTGSTGGLLHPYKG